MRSSPGANRSWRGAAHIVSGRDVPYHRNGRSIFYGWSWREIYSSTSANAAYKVCAGKQSSQQMHCRSWNRTAHSRRWTKVLHHKRWCGKHRVNGERDSRCCVLHWSGVTDLDDTCCGHRGYRSHKALHGSTVLHSRAKTKLRSPPVVRHAVPMYIHTSHDHRRFLCRAIYLRSTMHWNSVMQRSSLHRGCTKAYLPLLQDI